MSENQATPSIKVYTHPLSGHGHRVVLMLSLLQLPHQIINVPLPDLKKPEYLQKTPFGHIPFIEDGEFTLYDSTAILVYLATRYDDGAWLPREARSAATVQRWLSFASGPIYSGPNNARKVRQFGAPLDQAQAQALACAFLAVIEDELKHKAYAAGEAPTIADVAAYAYIALAPEGDISLEPYPAVRAWLARVEALPHFVPMHRGGLATLNA